MCEVYAAKPDVVCNTSYIRQCMVVPSSHSSVDYLNLLINSCTINQEMNIEYGDVRKYTTKLRLWQYSAEGILFLRR